MTTAARNSVTGGFKFAEYGDQLGSGEVRGQPINPVFDVIVPLVASRLTVEDDNGRFFSYNNAGAATFTVDLNMSSGFGFSIVQVGAGALTIAGAAGVTVSNVSGFTKTSGASSIIGIIQTGKNTYSIIGQGA